MKLFELNRDMQRALAKEQKPNLREQKSVAFEKLQLVGVPESYARAALLLYPNLEELD